MILDGRRCMRMVECKSEYKSVMFFCRGVKQMYYVMLPYSTYCR